MIWAYILAAALGLASGFWFKVYAIAILSLAILVFGTSATAASGWSIGWGFLVAFGAMFSFQCGYLLGLSLLCLARRSQTEPRTANKAARFDNASVETQVSSS
jgi:hypothetical protein